MTEHKIVNSIKWNCGSHNIFLGGIYNTLYNSITLGMNSVQFFFGSNRSLKRHQLCMKDINKAKQLCERFPINVFSHFPYIANLAGSKNVLAWEDDCQQNKKTECVVKELQYELGVMSNFKVNGVIIHPGNHVDRKKGICAIAESINKIKFVENSRLLLENSAGGGTSLATTFVEIKEIYDQVDENKKRHIGVCVDTAHIFGYGLYNLSTCKEVKKMFKDFDDIIGLDKLSLLHLNDSKVPLGSKKDRHELLGEGFIWGESFDSLILLLDLCQKYNIPIVLETSPNDMYTLCKLSNK